MTGKEIMSVEFERIGSRGFRSDQVESFLQSVASYIDEQAVEKKDLIFKMKILADKIEEYRKDEESIHEALLSAQKLGSSMLNEAKAKAEALTKESRAMAETLQTEAKKAYEEMMAQAKAKVESTTRELLDQANAEIKSVRRDCEQERLTLEKMKREVSSFKSSILKQYKSHLDILSALPSEQLPDMDVMPETLPKEPLVERTAPKAAPESILANEAELSGEEQFFSSMQNAQESFTRETEASAAPDFYAYPSARSPYEEAPDVGRRIPAKEPKPDFFARMPEQDPFLNERKADESAPEREFYSHPAEGRSFSMGSEQDIFANEEEDTDIFMKEEKKDPPSRPNYMERFGELKFGNFSDSE